MLIQRNKSTAIGWTVSPCFDIGLNIKDIKILKAIQAFLNVGQVCVSGKFARYRVRSRKELLVIIDHFTKYPLHTSKLINFTLFEETL
jgi:hypothetical protein